MLIESLLSKLLRRVAKFQTTSFGTMTTDIVAAEAPEDRNLREKRAELAIVEAELIQRELDLATLTVELNGFTADYRRMVGERIAMLDALKAQIAEGDAREPHWDTRVQEAAAAARSRADESASEARTGAGRGKDHHPEFRPSDELKRIYREVAKAVHPDLASDEQERIWRQELMARANLAYAAGDEDALRKILAEWRANPHSVKGDDIGAELIRVLRMIDRVRHRLTEIDQAISRLEMFGLYQLKLRADEESREGRNLLSEMTANLDQQIAA